MKGLKVSNFIVPMSVTDTYPTNLDIFGKGGIHSVDTIPNRDAITTERRSEGMLSFAKNNESMYALLGGITNDKWFKLFDFSDNKVNFNIACDPNYVLLGNKDGVAKPSPRLRDMQFDIIDLRREFDKIGVLETLDHNRIWIGDYTNRPVMQKTIGVNNLPILGAAQFPLPFGLESIALPNPTFSPTSPLAYIMSGAWLPQIYAGNPGKLDYTQTETIISSSLAMTQIKVAQALKRIDQGGLIVKSKNISFSWENPLANVIPEAVAQLYDYGTTYTFDKAQALDALEVGLLYNDSGVLSKAIGGKHYVDVAAPIANMQLALIRPLLEDQGQDISKLISRIDKVPIENLTNLTTGKIWQGVNNRPTEVTLSEAGIADKNATYILQTPDNKLPYSQALSSISGLLGGILKCNSLGVVSIASGGSTPLINDYVTPANLAEEKAERIGSDSAIETALVALEAEVEAEIAALAGVQTLSILATILGFIGVAAGGKGYGDYIRGQTLNVKNTWKAADLNDEGHNAVGDYEFRFPSGYSSDDRGHSTLWFDSIGRGGENKAEAGLRLFSWDSGGDHIGSDDPIAPLHIGLFGYQNKYHTWPFPNPTAKYKGFIFSIPDFHNESSSDDDYRFPKKFGLYDVTRTIGTWTSNKYGWDSKNTIFEYDYNNFCFYKNVEHNNYVNFKETVDFQKDVNIKNNLIFTPKDSVSNIQNSLFIQQITPTRKVLRYNIDGTTTQTPITEIVAGSNVTITKDLDIVTISSTQSSATTVVGTINQIKVVTSNLQNTVSLEPNLILGGSQLSFANTITGNIPTLPNYTLFFHTARLKYTDVGNNINIVGRVWDIVGTPNNISVNSLDPTSPIINLVNTTVIPNTYTNIDSLTVDSTGRITNIASGTAPLTSLNLTGAVTGTNTGSNVNTILNTTQTISGNNFSFNWLTPGVYANFNHYLADSSPLASSLPLFVQSYQSGNSSNNTARAWRMFFKPGYSSTPTDANFTLAYYHNTITEVNPLIIKNIGGSNFETTLIGGLILSGNINLNTNKLINVATPTSLTDGVNKSYADSLITNIAISSLSGYPSNASLFLRGDGNWVAPPNVGTVTSVGITGSTGLNVTGSPITSAGTINLTLGSELQALSAFAYTGLMARTGANSYAGRTLTQSTGISITNGDGVSGNPTIAIGTIPIANLSGYPSNSSLYLNGLGSWVNPLASLSITTDSISSTTSKINFANTVYMNSNALHLTANTNYGILYNSSLSFTEFRGVSGFVWKTGTAGATERMRLTSSGLDLNSSKLLNVLTPTVSTDGANKSYVDSAVSSANTKLQYFGSWDSTYPIYVTRSMYLNNSYTPPIREYGTYGFLNGNGNTNTATDSPVYDIKCNGRIRASEFNAWSSKNIKNILSIGKKAGEEASKILQDIPIVKYNYKDPIVDGKGEFFGVISEEILDYLPNYVTTNEFRFTPNIMIFGKLNSIDYQYFTILLQDDKTLDESFIGKKIQILKDNSSISGILESIENKFLTVKLESKVIITEKDLDVFVYGSYEDCPTVSLKHLSELSLCALVNCIERINKLEQIKEV